MQRRSFLKKSCTFCLLGSAGVTVLLEACSPKLSPAKTPIWAVNGRVTIPLSALQPAPAVTIIEVEKYPFALAVTPEANGQYSTLLLMCTHQDNPLNVSGNGYYCSTHGSRFSKAGAVENGPAEQRLHRLATSIVGTDLSVQLEKI